MSRLKPGWSKAALRDIVEVNPMSRGDRAPATRVTFVGMARVSEKSWKFESSEERPWSEVCKGFTAFKEGDVLFAKITPCMENGKAAVASGLKNGLGAGTTELHVIRPVGGINPFYLYHYLHQESFRRLAAMSMTGAVGQARVPVAFIEAAELPVPPLTEQHRIVAKLNDVLSKVDACQKRLEKVPAILKLFRKSVLSAAYSSRLTEDWRDEKSEPAWARKALGEFPLVVQTGPFGTALHKHDYVVGGVPIVNPMHIKDGRILADPEFSVSVKKAAELSSYKLKKGDVVLGRRGEMGRAAVVGVDGLLCGTGSLFIRAQGSDVNPQFLCLYLRSPQVVAHLNDASVGTTMANLNQRILAAIEFPAISVAEQKLIVDRVAALLKLAELVEARYNAAKESVGQLTQSIIAKAFRGELVPQDPKDEPAAVLLERIKSGREAGGKKEQRKVAVRA